MAEMSEANKEINRDVNRTVDAALKSYDPELRAKAHARSGRGRRPSAS